MHMQYLLVIQWMYIEAQNLFIWNIHLFALVLTTSNNNGRQSTLVVLQQTRPALP